MLKIVTDIYTGIIKQKNAFIYLTDNHRYKIFLFTGCYHKFAY